MAKELPTINTITTKKPPESKVPMTPHLEKLLNPQLNDRSPIVTGPIQVPKQKIYDLSEEKIQEIMRRRGAVVDLHPGMGGIAPSKLRQQMNEGVPLTSLDYMLTQGCNFECTWCFAQSGPLAKAYLPFTILEQLTQEAAEIGVSLFVLTGGEPLVYKDSALGKQKHRGDHFFQVVKMIRDTYQQHNKEAKILTFDDVALITPEIAQMFAEYRVGLCTKGDTLEEELQDFKVNQKGAFKKMQQGYQNLINAGYGSNPELRLVVNSVLDHTTFDGMIDLHYWVMENGWDHSIVPVHYCGNAENEDQETGIHSPHVKVLYDLIARIDREEFGLEWTPHSAFSYDKTCNRNMSGLHIRANGDITSCSESPEKEVTPRYTFGDVFEKGFSLKQLAFSSRLANYRQEFEQGLGEYVCNPNACDLNAHDLCRGGCATRSAYSKIDVGTGLIVKNPNPHNYSEHREDPLCPAWTILAQQQGVLKDGLLEEIHERLVSKSDRINSENYRY